MSHDVRQTIFRSCLMARAVEQALDELHRHGEIGTVTPAGDAHVAMIGSAHALESGDMLFGTRRDLPAVLARDVSVQTVFHQAFGTNVDPSLGRGMPGTVNEGTKGVSLSDGSPATHLVHAVGFGHAARLQSDTKIALGLFGSAAQANGELHAALNFAAVNRVNTVFVARGPLAGELLLSDLGQVWGINTTRVDGDDGLAVHDAVADARKRAIAGEGPTVVDARLDRAARPVDAQVLQQAQELSAEVERTLKEAVFAEIQASLKSARSAPTVSRHTLFNETYSDRPWFL